MTFKRRGGAALRALTAGLPVAPQQGGVGYAREKVFASTAANSSLITR